MPKFLDVHSLKGVDDETLMQVMTVILFLMSMDMVVSRRLTTVSNLSSTEY